jgi:hypothetical protein
MCAPLPLEFFCGAFQVGGAVIPMLTTFFFFLLALGVKSPSDGKCDARDNVMYRVSRALQLEV